MFGLCWFCPAHGLVNAQGLNDLPRFGHPRKPMLVGAFVAHRSVEALDEGVLDRLARFDECVLHTMLVGPARQRLACNLKSVVGQQPTRTQVTRLPSQIGSLAFSAVLS